MEPSFSREGDLLVPSPSAVSVWSDDMVNGHHLGGLVAWAVERDHPESALQVARLTVDMFRAVPMRPLRVVTQPTREGRRLRVVEVSVLDGDVEVTRGSALMLARSEHPPSTPWSLPPWDAPPPEDVEPVDVVARSSWEMRPLGRWGVGQGRLWMRELVPFIDGEEITPLVRAALAADYAHPLANYGDDGLAYINVDVTLYLARDPVGEWLGLEAATHMGTDGIAIGTAWLHDRDGRFGQSSVAATPDPRLQQQHGRRHQ